MDEKKIIDAYKLHLTQNQENVPEDLWQGIEARLDGEMDENLITQYREKVATQNQPVPEEVWNEISVKLEIDNIWNGIASRLDKQDKVTAIWWQAARVAASVAILIIGIWSAWLVYYSNSPQMAGSELTSQETVAAVVPDIESNPEQDIFKSDSPGNVPNIHDTGGGIIKSVSLPPVIGVNNPGIMVPAGAQHDKATYLQNIQQMEANLAGIGSGTPALSQKEISLPLLQEGDIYDAGNLLAINDGMLSHGGFAFGVTTSMKNTWLFNYETFQGLNQESPNKTRMQLYPDIAFSLRVPLSGRFEMEGNLSLSANSGQSYDEYLYGRYSHRQITLKYIHAELLASLKHKKPWIVNSHAITHKTSVGVYMGFLNSASETIEGRMEDISSVIRNDDYGVIAGHSLNIPITQKLLLSPGIQFHWGLPDIYKGEYSIPSLKSTYNKSFEFSLSLYYNFTR